MQNATIVSQIQTIAEQEERIINEHTQTLLGLVSEKVGRSTVLQQLFPQ